MASSCTTTANGGRCRFRGVLPNHLITRSYLARAFSLWLAIRILLAVAAAFIATNPIRLPAAGIAPIVVLTVLVAFIDTRWRHERALLGNLGISGITVAVLFAIPPLIAKFVMHVLVTR